MMFARERPAWRLPFVIPIILALLLAACLPPLLARTALPEAPAEAAGLSWRECAAGPEGEDWQQAEACFGHPLLVLDETDRAHVGERTAHGYRLRIGEDVYETYEHGLPLPNFSLYTLIENGRLQKLLSGSFSAYSPDLGLADLAGDVAWTFDDGRLATVVYGGADLRATYKLDAAYAPYALAGKLIFVGHRDEEYFVIYGGQRVGPAFDHILIAHCCEPAMYSARGGSGRYVFWGQRDGQRYMVEISALEAGAASSWLPYSDGRFEITLRYPTSWSTPPDPGQSVIRHGADGFFQLTAASVAGPSAEGICREILKPEAVAKDPQFGSAPVMETLTVAGQPACLITPSVDQRPYEGQLHLALLVIQYPEAMRPHSQFHLWADPEHIRQIGSTLQFVPVTTPAPSFAGSGPYKHLSGARELDEWARVGRLYDRAWNLDGAPNQERMLGVVEACTAALLEQPEQVVDYLTLRGVAYAHLGRYEQAVADYDAALEIRPSLVLLKNRGAAYADWGKPQEALRDLRAYLQQAEVLSKPPLDEIQDVRAWIRMLEAGS